MFSFNRVFLLSLGSVCFLTILFFWLALAFDYKALENFMVSLTKSKFVGYSVPKLFGAAHSDSIVSQVFRLKIFVSLALLFYSLFFISLYSVEENFRRLRFLFRGISIPIFLILFLFWQKFVTDDHIINKSEKSELFFVTISALVISIFLFAYSFRSRKRTIVKIKSKSIEQKDFGDPSVTLDKKSMIEPSSNTPSASEETKNETGVQEELNSVLDDETVEKETNPEDSDVLSPSTPLKEELNPEDTTDETASILEQSEEIQISDAVESVARDTSEEASPGEGDLDLQSDSSTLDDSQEISKQELGAVDESKE